MNVQLYELVGGGKEQLLSLGIRYHNIKVNIIFRIPFATSLFHLGRNNNNKQVVLRVECTLAH